MLTAVFISIENIELRTLNDNISIPIPPLMVSTAQREICDEAIQVLV
jgi:hypothetical protein